LEQDDLYTTATILQADNSNLKEKLKFLTEENQKLKHDLLGIKKEGKLNKIISSVTSDFSDNNKQLNSFKEFIFKQYFLYNGLTEDEVNYLNTLDQVSENDFENNKGLFMFKQKIIERNYREMMNNAKIGQEINQLCLTKKELFNKDNYVTPRNDTLYSQNGELLQNKINVEENKETKKKVLLEDLLMENDDEDEGMFGFGGSPMKK
jgi:hypothetical protein